MRKRSCTETSHTFQQYSTKSKFRKFALAALIIFAAALPAAAYSVGDITFSGGTVTAATDSSITVKYFITDATYIDSYYNTNNYDNGGLKNVVNGSNHYGGSVTRDLIGMPTIDSLAGYTISSVLFDLYCYRNIDTKSNWSIRAYAMTQSWTEDATWDTADGTTAWTNTCGYWNTFSNGTITGGGGSFDAETYVNAITEPVVNAKTTIDLTSIWSECNAYGVMVTEYLISTGSMEDNSTLDANNGYLTMLFDDDVTSNRPYISVTYAVPEPATMILLSGLFGPVMLYFSRLRKTSGRMK
jgi:hypothetical protein